MSNDANVHCQNCNTIMVGNFCYECGQSRFSPLRKLSVFVNDWLMEIFDWDRRLLPSLHGLLFRPGELTQKYWKGHRVGQIHPIRTYLILSLLYFAMLATFNVKGFLGGMVNSSETEFAQLMPNLMIVMVPVFSLILKGIYYRSRRLYTEHFVFSLHCFSFYFIFLIVSKLLALALTNILPNAVAPWIAGAESMAQLVIIGYLYIALQRCYRQSIVLSAVKTIVVIVLYLVSLVGSAILFTQ